MRVLLVGAGAVGSRAARQLHSIDGLDELIVHDVRVPTAERVAEVLGDGVSSIAELDFEKVAADVVVLAHEGAHAALAADALREGAHVVSVTDDVADVEALLALHDFAVSVGRSVVAGAGFAPGLTDLLAAHGAGAFDVIDEVHVGKIGTGGPACARQHHRALAGDAKDWRDGGWEKKRGGTGRVLYWFPDPIGAADCYRASLPDAVLLRRVFADAGRLTARMAATRRDRLTMSLPMMRKPHAEAGPGAVRVELRGRKGGVSEVKVYGAMDRASLAAGTVAALCAEAAGTGRLRRTGSGGVAEMVDAFAMLTELARRGVKAAAFEGSS